MNGCQAKLAELQYGHGANPAEGLQAYEEVKLGNISEMVKQRARLARTGEAFRVVPICASHNVLAKDTTRGRAAARFRSILEEGGDDDSALQELHPG